MEHIHCTSGVDGEIQGLPAGLLLSSIEFAIFGDVKTGPPAGKFDDDNDEQANWSLVKGF